jgi:hypothetical protein
VEALQPEAVSTDFRSREVSADAAGEVHLILDHLLPGRAYGLRWAW